MRNVSKQVPAVVICGLSALLPFHQFIHSCLHLAIVISGIGEFLLSFFAVAPLTLNDLIGNLVNLHLLTEFIDLYLNGIIVVTGFRQFLLTLITV